MEEKSVICVTRIIPLPPAQSGSFSNLLKPSDLGKPIEVKTSVVTDPRTGITVLLETTFCLRNAKDLGKIPGLIPLTRIDSALTSCKIKESGRELVHKVPKNIPVEKLPRLHAILKENGHKPSTKTFLDLKESNEAKEQKFCVQDSVKLVSPLLKYAMQNECLICGTFLNTSLESVVMTHMSSHTKSGAYVCQDCRNKPFATAESLFNHSFEHPDSMDYICDVCNCKFNRKYFLSTHYEKEHSDCPLKCSIRLTISFVCSVCKARLTSREQLQDHKNMHLGTQTYFCLFCSRTFTSSYSLIRYHAHVQLFLCCHRCKICYRAFSSRHQLKKHEKIHRMKFLHVCNLCGKKFNFSINLKKHLKLHSKT